MPNVRFPKISTETIAIALPYPSCFIAPCSDCGARNIIEELAHGERDFVNMCLESEMPRVEKTDARVWIVTSKGFRAGRYEVRIVPSPDCEKRRFRFAEIPMERRIEPYVVCIVEEQV